MHLFCDLSPRATCLQCHNIDVLSIKFTTNEIFNENTHLIERQSLATWNNQDRRISPNASNIKAGIYFVCRLLF